MYAFRLQRLIDNEKFKSFFTNFSTLKKVNLCSTSLVIENIFFQRKPFQNTSYIQAVCQVILWVPTRYFPLFSNWVTQLITVVCGIMFDWQLECKQKPQFQMILYKHLDTDVQAVKLQLREMYILDNKTYLCITVIYLW